MSATQIADVIVPEIFAPYVQEASVNTNRLLTSGAVASNPVLDMKLAAGGTTFNVPSWDHVANGTDDYDVSGDDPTSLATPAKLGTSVQVAARLERNRSWSTMDLAGSLAGSDPTMAIASQLGAYRMKQRNKTLVNQLTGMLAAASMSSHVNDIGTTAIDASAVIDTTSVFGDFVDDRRTLVMHGDVYRKLQKLNLITFEKVSAQDLGFGTYLGMSVYVDDALPKVAVGSPAANQYTSYIFNYGVIGFGYASPKNEVETDRAPLQGDGGGADILVVRDCYCFHLNGMKWIGTPAGATPSNAELAVGTNWLRVYDDKNVGLAALKHGI